MTANDVLREIAETLHVSPDRVTPETRAEDLEEWDSIGTMMILLLLDGEYGLKLDSNQTGQARSVEGVLELLRSAGKLS